MKKIKQALTDLNPRSKGLVIIMIVYLMVMTTTITSGATNQIDNYQETVEIQYQDGANEAKDYLVRQDTVKNVLDELDVTLNEKDTVNKDMGYIVQSKDLNEINPNVVNSFRIVTLYKDGKAYVINNALRINQDETDVIGCTNDLYFSLDESGKIDSNVIDDYANVYNEHPLTKKKFSDVKINGVKEAFEMCKEAAKKFLK